MSDIDRHKRWLRDMGGRTNLEALAAIEALEGEIFRLKEDVETADADANRFQSIAIEADNEKMLAVARAERLRAAMEETVRTTPKGSMIHERLSKILEDDGPL